MPIYAWAAAVLFLARVMHLRLAFAAPGATLTVPVPAAMVAALGLTAAVLIVLIARGFLRPAVARSAP